MTTVGLPLNEITHQAITILCREIGVVNTIRFIHQFTNGYGNYTEEKANLFKDQSLDSIIKEIKELRKKK